MKIISGYTYKKGSPEDSILNELQKLSDDKARNLDWIARENANQNRRVHELLSGIEKCNEQINDYFAALKKLDPDVVINWKDAEK